VRVYRLGGADRRSFLTGAAAIVLGMQKVSGATGQPEDARSISLVHTHTGETLTTNYFRDGAYVSAELDRIDHLLRDFRTGEVHRIDPKLLDELVELRELGGFAAPYQVISGYRSPQTNEALRRRSDGVSEHSLHMQGRAIDVRIKDFPTERLHELALGMRRGGVGFYPASNFVHLDTGRVRSW
jgi:uncharacterized protein YcbK (DUF882 family)